MNKVYIIAEIGVNHNGNLDLAKKMIDIAADAGADAAKFQSFSAKLIVSKKAPKAQYQIQNTGKSESQYEMLQKLEISRSDHIELIEHCKKNNIDFISTPFDENSIQLLNELKVEPIKIASGEIVNLPYLRKIGGLSRKLILSTGMAFLQEIEDAIQILEAAGTTRKDICVLHCNTEYPTPFSDVNLRAMITISNKLGVDVGYSDHTKGIEVPIAAATLGAKVIEKHFTLDRNMEGPDHAASLEPCELKVMIAAIRNIEKALGSSEKKPSPSEAKNRDVVRKSIVANQDIKKGQKFDESNLCLKRPGTGLSPMKWDQVIGATAKKDFKLDDPIEL